MIGRRALIGTAAGIGLAALAARPAAAAPQSNAGSFRRVIIGASVTRLAAQAPDGLRYQIPWLCVDGLDDGTHGGTASAIDGRGLTMSVNNPRTLWDGFQSELARGVLRPGSGDWCVMEWSLGTEPVATAAPVVDQIIAACATNGLRLAWVIPSAYYTDQVPPPLTVAQQVQWNADARAMLTAKVPPAGGVLIDWQGLVAANVSMFPAASQLAKDNRNPLCYDGRHPTGASTTWPGRGCLRYAAAVADATGI